ncbi:hypothetical protein WN51_00599 [Melipona quadrifasciata]|uniref:Uncharacterized protein n=1 Tax=Melipona quadrifasciata TaxID=166423 RepID=A0A0N0BGB0_9HYME|nr:hypothetical protein WN51_00599 [Melipona quadrifasciata]
MTSHHTAEEILFSKIVLINSTFPVNLVDILTSILHERQYEGKNNSVPIISRFSDFLKWNPPQSCASLTLVSDSHGYSTNTYLELPERHTDTVLTQSDGRSRPRSSPILYQHSNKYSDPTHTGTFGNKGRNRTWKGSVRVDRYKAKPRQKNPWLAPKSDVATVFRSHSQTSIQQISKRRYTEETLVFKIMIGLIAKKFLIFMEHSAARKKQQQKKMAKNSNCNEETLLTFEKFLLIRTLMSSIEMKDCKYPLCFKKSNQGDHPASSTKLPVQMAQLNSPRRMSSVLSSLVNLDSPTKNPVEME